MEEALGKSRGGQKRHHMVQSRGAKTLPLYEGLTKHPRTEVRGLNA
jgi:hypothetical protein